MYVTVPAQRRGWGFVNIKKGTSLVRSKKSSKVIFVSLVRYFDRGFYGVYDPVKDRGRRLPCVIVPESTGRFCSRVLCLSRGEGWGRVLFSSLSLVVLLL